MTDLKVYSYPQNPKVWKAQIAGKYTGVPVDAPAFEFGVDNKTDAFLKKNPLGKVPTLESSEGCIWESNAIARYAARLGKNNIYGKNAFESALIDQWIDFTIGEIDLPGAAWLYPIWGYIPNNATATAKAQGDIKKVLSLLNNHLATRTFLVGDRLSLADIVVSMSLILLFKYVLDASFRKPFANTMRWFNTCINQPNFKEVIGEVALCEKMAVADPNAAPAAAAKKEKPAPKEKAAPKPKAAEPAEEEEEKPKEKPKNPLDLLPPTKLNLEDWKRFYSNNDADKSIPHFWEIYEPEGWSLWFCDYKYPDELEKVYMTCNLAAGMIHRLESLRKYGFGQLAIMGNDEDKGSQQISGCFLVRGTEMPPELTGCPDWESYTWTKVDPSKPEDKKLVNAYWAWEGEFPNGRKFNQGKQFK